ncbi:hypothetical protein NGM10_10040 [Halorussus salilacus]|uniref:DUF7573 domain-containing protein n=1 Tax=Halorussus salilacus TaxID=2953750 RepID=UPI00209E2515|nr:hypothetical protein [Halorussus salilacus]USZ67070.1 hypothetical protein NGM10_10040 [Halorussus salilacus]
MTEDASLDAFASGERDDETGDPETGVSGDDSTADHAETDSTADHAATDSAASAAESVEPASSTFAWSPEGGECANCGASVERRWRADGQKDGGLVCADCKEW